MPSNYTGNPIAVQSPSSAPGPGVAPIVSIPSDTTDDMNTAAIAQMVKVPADFLAYLLSKGPLGGFGDGSDGTVTLDGTVAAPAWANKVGAVYTMTRDVYLAGLTVTGATTQLVTNGYRLYVNGTLTTASGGIIHNNGSAGSGTTGGNGGGAGILAGGSVGGAGATAGAGTGGTNQGAGVMGFGGAGGVGGGGNSTAGGAGGTVNAFGSGFTPRSYSPVFMGSMPYASSSINSLTTLQAVSIAGGAGGGGGGSGTGNGGAGGGGAGTVAIAARNVVLANASDIQAKGGNGVNPAGTTAGAGGGGGGGSIVLYYWTLTISAGSFSAATNCTGGAAGTNTGTGTVPAAGTNGQIFAVQLV